MQMSKLRAQQPASRDLACVTRDQHQGIKKQHYNYCTHCMRLSSRHLTSTISLHPHRVLIGQELVLM